MNDLSSREGRARTPSGDTPVKKVKNTFRGEGENDEDKMPSANEHNSKTDNDLYIDHILKKDGQDIFFYVNCEPVYDDNGDEYAEGSSGDEDEDYIEEEENQRRLPPATSTIFWYTNDNDSNAQLIKKWYSADSGEPSSHFQGVRNRNSSLEVSDELFLFAQGTIPQVFFSLIGEDGFDIRNLTQGQLDKLKNQLPDGWVLTLHDEADDDEEEEEEDDDGDKVSSLLILSILYLINSTIGLLYAISY